MARKKLSAKAWAEKPDTGFVQTVVKIPDDVEEFSPKKEGTYRIDIIPYVVPDKSAAGPNPNAAPGELHYERTFFIHRDIGVDEQRYVCPKRTAGKPCPICEHRKEIMEDPNGDEDLAKALAPKQRQLWNVFDHEEPGKGVKVWEVSYHLFGKQLKREVMHADEDDGYEYFADPEEGMKLRVGMEEQKIGKNSFLEAATIGFKPRTKALPKKVLDGAHPLDNLIIIYPYDKLKTIFLHEEGVDAEGDEDERPVKRDEPKKTKAVTADDKGIGKGDDVAWKGQEWTVLKITGDGESLTLVNNDDEDLIKKGVLVEDVELPGNGEEDAGPTKEGGDSEPTAGQSSTKKEENNGGSTASKDDSVEDDDWDADW